MSVYDFLLKSPNYRHSFQAEENHVAIPVQWPSDFISSCQTSAVLFVVIHAGEGWRLKLIGGATGKSTNSFQDPLTYMGLLAVSANFTSLWLVLFLKKLILKSQVRWIQ